MRETIDSMTSAPAGGLDNGVRQSVASTSDLGETVFCSVSRVPVENPKEAAFRKRFSTSHGPITIGSLSNPLADDRGFSRRILDSVRAKLGVWMLARSSSLSTLRASTGTVICHTPDRDDRSSEVVHAV